MVSLSSLRAEGALLVLLLRETDCPRARLLLRLVCGAMILEKGFGRFNESDSAETRRLDWLVVVNGRTAKSSKMTKVGVTRQHG